MKKLYILFILTCSIKALTGQTDTVIVPESVQTTQMAQQDRIYRLFMEQNNQDIKRLFKFNIIALSQIAPVFSYEQKLWKCFSIETSINMGSAFDLESRYSPTFIAREVSDYGNGFYVGGFQMIKYYYNLKRRERLGKNTNGFSGNYFAVQVAGIFMHYDHLFNYRYENNKINPEFDLTYGMQRRIGNIGYIEPSTSLFLIPKDNGLLVMPSINLEMGFAIDSFSNLRRMLKK